MKKEYLGTDITIVNHNEQSTVMRVQFPDDCTGTKRCFPPDKLLPDAIEDCDNLVIVRLLGAAMIEMLDHPTTIRGDEAARVAAIAKTHVETAVMYAIKGLHRSRSYGCNL